MALRARNILYAPDYVINGGGLIALAVEYGAETFSPERAKTETAGIGRTLTEVFARADREGRPTSEVADAIAMERVARGARRSA